MEIEIKVLFTKRLYGTPDGDFSVFAAVPATNKDKKKVELNRYGNFTISGDYALDDSELGKPFTATIQEDHSSKYQNSYKLLQLHYEFPETAIEQWQYLENSDVVSYRILMNLMETFSHKDKIIDIILYETDKLTKVKGISETRANVYRERLLNDKGKALISTKYGNIEGVGPLLIKKILNWKPNVEDALKLIEDDPFVLLEIEGVGFLTADKIRDYHGYSLYDLNRILHGVKHYITDQFQNTGNTYEDIEIATLYAAEKLQVTPKAIVDALAKVHKDEKLMKKFKLKLIGRNITTLDLHEAESVIYKELGEASKISTPLINEEKWAKAKDEYLSKMTIKVSEEQEKFLDTINKEKVTVLLGPGGAGKSWLTKIAVDLFHSFDKTVGLFAPTARAAHVMQEYVGREASTIHRGLMKYAMVGEAAPYDVIIVDEFSMVDSELAAIVIKALRRNARLIIIGDAFQLPSVGPGNVLHDLTHYMDVTTVELTQIFRQKEGSGILDYADDLRRNSFHLAPGAGRMNNNDIVFINESDPERQREIAMNHYKQEITEYNSDVMLLSPVNRGEAGRGRLNRLVQDIVNPSSKGSEIVFGQQNEEEDRTYYRAGDYITVKSNHYDMETDFSEIKSIINGDLGHIVSVAGNKLTFTIDDDRYTIDKSEIREMIDHAWAITIHRAQGGQADVVIIVLPSNSYGMMNANMLYTAITRAKKKCYVIGDFNKMNQSAKKRANFHRKTLISLQSKVNERKKNKAKEHSN